MSTLSVNTIKDVQYFDFANTNFASAYGTANSGYIVANAAFGKANTALQNTTGTFAGTLTATGTFQSTSSTGFLIQNATSTGSNALRIINNSGSFYFGTENSAGTDYGLPAYSSFLYSNYSTPMCFVNNGSERMRIDTSGNLGIATTSPTDKLEVNGNFRVTRPGTPSTQYAQIYADATGTNFSASAASGTLNLSTNGGTTKMFVLDGSGNVGIGRTPTYSLDVQGNGNTIRIIGESGGERIMTNSYGDNTAGGVFSMYKARGTIASPTGVLNGDYNGIIRGFAYDGAGSFRETHRIGFYHDANASADNVSGYMRFWTRPAGAAGVLTERMRITSDGNVGIGTASPEATLDVNGSVKGAVTSGGSVATTSGTTKEYTGATGIPSWAKRVTVTYQGVSLSGSSALRIQLGTSGGYVTSGYTGGTQYLGIGTATLSAGFDINGNFNNAGNAFTGHFIFTLAGSNIWVCSSVVFSSGAGTQPNLLAGYISLGGTLTRLRITTVNGTDTFDAGLVNMFYEG